MEFYDTHLDPLFFNVIESSHALPILPVLALPEYHAVTIESMQVPQSSIKRFAAIRCMWQACVYVWVGRGKRRGMVCVCVCVCVYVCAYNGGWSTSYSRISLGSNVK